MYHVDVTDGSRKLLVARIQDTADLSPGAQYISWWDRDERAWMIMPSVGGKAVNVSADLPHRVDNEIHDWPYKPNSYGYAGWTENDEEFLVYDKHDIWALDPTGNSAPRAVTNGYGRQYNLRLRHQQLDFEEDTIAGELLLSAFHYDTKVNGFYADDVDDHEMPEELIMMERSFGSLQKADDADVLLLTRESFEEFEDLWIADSKLNNMRRISDVNPQQAEYRWGTAELVSWTSLDGIPLQGMLFKPEGFDASKEYPMMVYFYEKMSSGLYQHRPPQRWRIFHQRLFLRKSGIPGVHS